MALTITKTGDWYSRAGNKNEARVQLALDTSYPTGGYSFKPADVGMRTFELVSFSAQRTGYQFDYDYTNQKIQVFRSAGFTPAGTVAVPVVTVTGGQGAGTALQMTPDSTAGVLGKTTATTMAIPGATFGIGAQAFTGTAVAASPAVEVANGVDLSAVTGMRVDCIGY